MLIIPAIDIKGGRCVRLMQGRMDEETVYSTNPLEVAMRWQSEGAGLVHLVDLDAAVSGRTVNHEVIEKIAASLHVPVQVGGGIRDFEAAERYLALKNVKRIVIGTAALEDQAFAAALMERAPGRVAVGIDAKDGMVATRGWVEVSTTTVAELARRAESFGASCVVYTDISRDGTLSGPNIKATMELASTIGIPVIASGGMSRVEDIEAYMRAEEERGIRLGGVIIGRALYAGTIRLGDAIGRAG